jgi:hypothetical protein
MKDRTAQFPSFPFAERMLDEEQDTGPPKLR